jgi:hypothetical protein
MTLNLYPQNFQESMTLLGALIPFIALAVGAVWRAWTYQREQKQKEWERLHVLVKTLYNKDEEYGLWAQLAAVQELKTLKINQTALAAIVSNVVEFWTKPGTNAELLNELRELRASLRSSPKR